MPPNEFYDKHGCAVLLGDKSQACALLGLKLNWSVPEVQLGAFVALARLDIKSESPRLELVKSESQFEIGGVVQSTATTNILLSRSPSSGDNCASDTSKRRTGKSMSRRAGQGGCVQKDGKWYVVRYWKDIAGQEKRRRVWEKICPTSGPGKLSASERERRAKEIIAASKVDTVEYFNQIVRQVQGVTFREQAAIWLDQLRNRKRKPLAPSTLLNWENHLHKWINPNLGDMPLEAVNNLAVKNLVTVMCNGGLSPKSIENYVQVVKMVVASAVNEQGEELYPRRWNAEFIDMPVVRKQEQRSPAFTGDLITAILAATKKQKYFVFFALLGSAGLRFGEGLGIDIKDISPNCSSIKIHRKAWRGHIHNRLKTQDSKREIDLHPSMATVLKTFIGEKKSGLLFASRSGRPLQQSNVLRHTLHPILAAIGQPKCGAHAFRRFRNTYLRNYTSCPEGLRKFWLGWSNEDMDDLYDKIRENAAFRKAWAEKAGLGFDIPARDFTQKRRIGRNGRKNEPAPVFEVVANA